MIQLRSFLTQELKQGKTIYPHGKDIFAAFNWTPFNKLKVVIIGQDPYHAPRQAHGLCFSVRPEIPIPPSLTNIFKEQQMDLGLPTPNHGCLTFWAQQGVLLLNNVLTVEAAKAASHQNRGWEPFTDKVVSIVNELQENIVFLLWGSAAQKKGQVINPLRHHVLKAPHPSPLSAHRGFFGCGHFSKTNKILQSHRKNPYQLGLTPTPGAFMSYWSILFGLLPLLLFRHYGQLFWARRLVLLAAGVAAIAELILSYSLFQSVDALTLGSVFSRARHGIYGLENEKSHHL